MGVLQDWRFVHFWRRTSTAAFCWVPLLCNSILELISGNMQLNRVLTTSLAKHRCYRACVQVIDSYMHPLMSKPVACLGLQGTQLAASLCMQLAPRSL